MRNINEIIGDCNSSYDDIIKLFERIKDDGNVVVIKFDGERESNKYTSFISYPNQPSKELIRYDGDNLKEILLNLLKDYYKEN